jgi:VanZ family protein
MPPATPNPAQWILPLFFAANAALTAWLIPALGVKASLYQTFPWIFGAAFAVSLIPAARRQMTHGSLVWRLTPVGLYAIVISLASSVNPSVTAGVQSNVFHPVEYAGLAFCAQLAAHGGASRRPRWGRILWVALACVAFGVADELHQSFVPRRACTALDVGLDTLGAAAGTLVYLATHHLVTRLSPASRKASS